MTMPKVSIVIPVYNGSNYMKEAIDSALAQTYENIEIVVVNDGSKDDGATENIALSYGDKIRYFHKENGGSSSALNYGIKQMEGEYFSWLSHDDLYELDKVKKQIEIIQNNSYDENTVVICSSKLIDKDGNNILHTVDKKNDVLTGKEAFVKLCKKEYSINGCSVLLPKKLIDKIGLFNEKFVFLNDIDYWTRLMLNNCTFVKHSDILVKGRVHQSQVTNTKKDCYFKERVIWANNITDFLSTYSEKEDLLRQFLIFCYKDQNYESAGYIKKALKSKGLFSFKIALSCFFMYCYGSIVGIMKYFYKKLVKNRKMLK